MAGERDGGAFLTGIVLAAGASVRMGRPKQLLPLHGRPLLQHVLDAAAAAGFDEIVLVLGSLASTIRDELDFPARPRVQVVDDPACASGQAASLRAGLAAADPRATAAVVLLGDQPGVTDGLIRRVLAAFLAGSAPVARPAYGPPGGARVPGHPVVLARRMWPALATLRGDEGARAVLAAHPDWVLEVAIDGEPPADLDTQDDYRRALRTLATTG